MIFKVKCQSHIKMHFNYRMSKIISRRSLVSSCTTIYSTTGQNVRITFQVKGQGHRVNELKTFSYKFLVVVS